MLGHREKEGSLWELYEAVLDGGLRQWGIANYGMMCKSEQIRLEKLCKLFSKIGKEQDIRLIDIGCFNGVKTSYIMNNSKIDFVLGVDLSFTALMQYKLRMKNKECETMVWDFSLGLVFPEEIKEFKINVALIQDVLYYMLDSSEGRRRIWENLYDMGVGLVVVAECDNVWLQNTNSFVYEKDAEGLYNCIEVKENILIFRKAK